VIYGTASELADALRDRYLIERELGRGGMATVYLARDLKHDRLVALKVIHPELAATLGPERFLREVQLTARLQHPHILPVHDSGEAAGRLWYTMPFVEGESLRDRLNRERQLSLDEALQIGRDVLAALAYAHSRGVIHRDIKPENILLEAGEAVVADFGIARAISAAGSEHLTQTGMAVGTPAYMSPEQAAAGTALDGRSDLYSVGCVLYEILAGEPPYTGPTPQAVMAKRFLEPVPHLRTMRDTVPEAVERAVTKALAKVPADRYATATEFAEALQTLSPPLAGQRPPPVRRARREVPLLAFGLLVVLLGLGSLWLGRRSFFPSRAGAHSIESLAVLPLDNLSGDPQQEYFADGMTEALIGDLSTISTLRVISRRSVMQYKSARKPLPEIARALHVDAVVEGTVLRAGDRVRITAQLLEAATDRHLWSGTYQREMKDVLSLQGEVAQLVAQEVASKLSAGEQVRLAAHRPVDPAAYEAYLEGRYFWNTRTEEGLAKAIGYFRQAIEKDSSYAPAHTAVADYYNALPFYSRVAPSEAFPQAKAAALRALALDGTLAEAHAALAFVKAYYEWDWAGAEQEFQRALTLRPSDAGVHFSYSRYLASTGRHPEAMAELRRAQVLDPLSIGLKANEGMVLYFNGEYDQAIQLLRKTLELDSTHAVAHWGLGMALEQKAMFPEAAREIQKAIDVEGPDPNFLSSLGHVYAAMGRTAEVRKLLQRLAEEAQRSYVSPYHAAVLYAGLGESDKAFEQLDQAARERSTLLVYLRKDPRLKTLRRDRRFQALLARIGLPGD
jgi:serine/threonine protein kinase/tetratricopeptide (TPR) repeat protein